MVRGEKNRQYLKDNNCGLDTLEEWERVLLNQNYFSGEGFVFGDLDK